jgi:imidazolonepropionase-like amidohydrolase
MALLLRAERLVTGAGVLHSGDAYVAIEGERIVGAGAGVLLPDPSPADTVVDVPGGTILPGFIEAHTHLHCSAAPDAYDDVMTDSLPTAVLRAGAALRTLLAAGVTTARYGK